MNIVLLLNEVSADASPSDRDVLMQRDAVTDALCRLGHHVTDLYCTLDLAAVRSQLTEQAPDLVFNLVESLGGTDQLMAVATLLLDSLRIPYTGAPTRCILTTSDKLFAKRLLASAGIPTPPWLTSDAPRHECPLSPAHDPSDSGMSESDRCSPACRMIVKAVWEHASFDLDDHCLFEVSAQSDMGRVTDYLRSRAAATGRSYFAERYIEGREFNLSLVAGPDGPRVLPPAEIDFAAYPPDKPRIVGYRAKWEEDSFEYHHTPRRFDFAADDRSLLDQLQTLAVECWHAVGLRGYARVDFRVDAAKRPWVLEINANPCLALDAGFAAAVDQAGLSYDTAISWIIGDTARVRPWKKDGPS